MAQLSSVIGSILRDIISAQHEANLYSLSLSENYGKDGKVKDFQLPGVFISDISRSATSTPTKWHFDHLEVLFRETESETVRMNL